MRNVIFQIATEFHYMVSLSIIDKYFNEDDYNYYFIIKVDNERNRGGRLKNVRFRNSHKIIEICYSLEKNLFYPDVLKLIKLVNEKSFWEYIGFHVFDPLYIYLSYLLKKRGTRISLAPDGLGAYVKFGKVAIGSRLRLTFYAYRFFFNHHLYYPKFYFCNYRFGFNGKPDNLFSFSIENPFAKKCKSVSIIDININKDNINDLTQIFPIPELPLLETKNVILIIHAGYSDFDIFVNKLVEYIKYHEPDRLIIYKLHPNYIKESFDKFKGIKNFIFINKSFPVELLIYRLNDSIIISSHSTSMLYNNKKCTYYWAYPILEKLDIITHKIHIFNPTTHIKVINSFNEIILSSESRDSKVLNQSQLKEKLL